MNPARLQSFILAYGGGLVAAIKAHPKQYVMQRGDTPETRALRTAMTVHDLLRDHGVKSIDWRGEGFVNACATLGIRCDEVVVGAWLEGPP